MKTLSSEREIALTLKESPIKKRNKFNFRFQELYEYLNQFKYNNHQILLSIILPAYNEEQTIKQILESLPKDDSIEIIVIDDNSTDNSVIEVKKANNNRKIKLIKHKQNRGYGGAIITGIKQAKGVVIVTMDSDGQHCPQDLLKIVKPIFEGEADCTLGSRYLGRSYYNLPIKTRLGEAIIEKILQIGFGQKIMNNQNGFRAFNRQLVPFYVKAKYHGFTYATEMLIITLANRYKIKECPVKVYEREHGVSKINLIKLILNLLTCFVRYYFKKFKVNIKNRTLHLI